MPHVVASVWPRRHTKGRSEKENEKENEKARQGHGPCVGWKVEFERRARTGGAQRAARDHITDLALAVLDTVSAEDVGAVELDGRLVRLSDDGVVQAVGGSKVADRRIRADTIEKAPSSHTCPARIVSRTRIGFSARPTAEG